MFELSEEHQMIRDMVREFAQAEIAPRATEMDDNEEIPRDLIDKMAEINLLGMGIPEEYGGAGMDTLGYLLSAQEVSAASASVGLMMGAHHGLACAPILAFGTEEQKQKYLAPMARGEHIGAFGLTEPQAGSDAGGTRTTAVRKGNVYVINGRKVYITNGGVAQTCVATARTDPHAEGNKGISAFIVETSRPGFRVGTTEKKMGMKASNTVELIFEDMEVPAENLLGNEGEGFKQFLHTLDGGRIGIGGMAVGIHQACLDRSVQYSRERKAFGKPIAKFQAIAFMIAQMATELEASRLLVYQAARLKDEGKPYTTAASMAKLFASEACMRAADRAIQIHGGYGYCVDYAVERYFRDAKLLEIGEGTSEIQKLVISRDIIGPIGAS